MTRIDPNTPANIGYVGEGIGTVLDTIEKIRKNLVQQIIASNEESKHEMMENIQEIKELQRRILSAVERQTLDLQQT
jgi:hypothetical protein